MCEENKSIDLEDLENVTGGTNEDYTYRFKIGDFVYTTTTKTESLIIQENVETNSSTYKVKCEKCYSKPTRISSPDELIRYESCSNIMMMYRMNGGKFYWF